jgi:hypothetical protein
MKLPLPVALAAAALFATALTGADTPPYRTDLSADEKLPWFQLVDGEFPPPDSAHHIAGELISVNHVNRTFALRADRTDKQSRSHMDLPLGASMLPYGSIFYHGAWASLEDIPLGTHLHGQFYLKHPHDKTPPITAYERRITPESDFTRCILLEDDFSYDKRQSQIWKIESIDPETHKLSASRNSIGKSGEEAKTFSLLERTRVWKGNHFLSTESLAPGQKVLFNLTWATLVGPGRILDLWVDDEARAEASAHQLRIHRRHTKERGMPAWVTRVDNAAQILTLRFFDNFDPTLLQDLHVTEETGELKERHNVALAAALDSLAPFDPVNDRRSGPVKAIRTTPASLGGSGVEIDVRPDFLLEGFRPKKVVRVYAHGWPVVDLPKEIRWEGREYDLVPGPK